MLSLVFVETLYLYVEDAVCVEDDVVLLDILCEFLLGKLLYSKELVEDFLVILELAEIFKLCAVLDELCADSVLEELCERRIGLIQPASVSDTVGNVLEFFRSILIFIVEYRLLDNL